MQNSVEPGGDIASGRAQLIHAVGMHARPAVKLTKLAKRFESQVAVRVAGGNWINAKSITQVMALRAAHDAILEFEASGTDAQAAVAALVALVEQDFPAPER